MQEANQQIQEINKKIINQKICFDNIQKKYNIFIITDTNGTIECVYSDVIFSESLFSFQKFLGTDNFFIFINNNFLPLKIYKKQENDFLKILNNVFKEILELL
jgi:hypothetical protein